MPIVELSHQALAILALAVAAASFITSLTGMAGGVLMFAAMNIYIPVRALVPIHGVVQMFNNATRSYHLRQDLRWSMVMPCSLRAILSAAATTVFIARYVGELFPLRIILVLTAYTVFRPVKAPPLKVSDKNFFWVGVATGSIGIIAGAVDPILAIFFLREDLSKESIVANKSMMQLVVHLTKIPAFIYLGFSFLEHADILIVLSLAGVVGGWLGVLALRRIQSQAFITLMKSALFISGAHILYQLIEMVI